MSIESVSAITLATHDMVRSFAFYEALGFECTYGDPHSPFVTFKAGTGYLNLTVQASDKRWTWWGRAIFHVDDVDRQFERAEAAGFKADTSPCDAPWGERYFHITDPDGHELSFARRLGD